MATIVDSLHQSWSATIDSVEPGTGISCVLLFALLLISQQDKQASGIRKKHRWLESAEGWDCLPR